MSNEKQMVYAAKVIGIEKVSYFNYLGRRVSGARISFCTPLSDEGSVGVKTYYQWVSEEKLPRNLELGQYYDLEFDITSNGNLYFKSMSSCPEQTYDVIDFKFSC